MCGLRLSQATGESRDRRREEVLSTAWDDEFIWKRDVNGRIGRVHACDPSSPSGTSIERNTDLDMTHRLGLY